MKILLGLILFILVLIFWYKGMELGLAYSIHHCNCDEDWKMKNWIETWTDKDESDFNKLIVSWFIMMDSIGISIGLIITIFLLYFL